jgi:putative transposase
MKTVTLNFLPMVHVQHYDLLGTARFVTFSCHQRFPFLDNDTVAAIVLTEIDWARKKYGLRIFGYVIMPEHVHLVILPGEGCQMGHIIGTLKWRSARRIVNCFQLNDHERLRIVTRNPGRSQNTLSRDATTRQVPSTTSLGQEANRVPGHPADNRHTTGVHRVWLPRCYDHNCRSKETVIEKINYCHWNPVKRGLVAGPEEWKWSSYRWYAEQSDPVLELDQIV